MLYFFQFNNLARHDKSLVEKAGKKGKLKPFLPPEILWHFSHFHSIPHLLSPQGHGFVERLYQNTVKNHTSFWVYIDFTYLDKSVITVGQTGQLFDIADPRLTRDFSLSKISVQETNFLLHMISSH